MKSEYDACRSRSTMRTEDINRDLSTSAGAQTAIACYIRR